MIIVRAPFRCSFVGGGTDLPSHFREHGGAVLSMAVNKYVYMTGRRMFSPDQTLVKYSSSELVTDLREIRHPIFRSALQWLDVSGVDIGVSSDIPAGTGLGSSSTFSVALLSLLHELKGEEVSTQHIAELACELEIDRLGENIGKQDQFASAYGGVNLFRFRTNNTVDALKLKLSDNDIDWLEKSCWLVKLPGEARSASQVLKEAQSFTQTDAIAQKTLKAMARLAEDAFSLVNSEGIRVLPEIVRDAWELKQRANPPQFMDVAVDTIGRGLRAGALAGKLLGAGGGGFAFFFLEESQQERFLDEFSSEKVLHVRPDFHGVTTIYRGAE